jgi:hypothetical protein
MRGALLPPNLYEKMAVFWVVAPCSMVDVYQTTLRNIPEDSHLHTSLPSTNLVLQDNRRRA